VELGEKGADIGEKNCRSKKPIESKLREKKSAQKGKLFFGVGSGTLKKEGGGLKEKSSEKRILVTEGGEKWGDESHTRYPVTGEGEEGIQQIANFNGERRSKWKVRPLEEKGPTKTGMGK